MVKNQKSNSPGIEHKKLGNSTEKGRGMIKKWKSAQKLETQKLLIALRPVDRFVGAGIFKRLPCSFFYIVLLHSSRVFTGFGDLRALKACVFVLGRLLFLQCVTTSFDIDPSPFQSSGFQVWASLHFSYFSWTSMAPRRESTIAMDENFERNRRNFMFRWGVMQKKGKKYRMEEILKKMSKNHWKIIEI